jgi:hypothetical protein
MSPRFGALTAADELTRTPRRGASSPRSMAHSPRFFVFAEADKAEEALENGIPLVIEGMPDLSI